MARHRNSTHAQMRDKVTSKCTSSNDVIETVSKALESNNPVTIIGCVALGAIALSALSIKTITHICSNLDK